MVSLCLFHCWLKEMFAENRRKQNKVERNVKTPQRQTDNTTYCKSSGNFPEVALTCEIVSFFSFCPQTDVKISLLGDFPKIQAFHLLHRSRRFTADGLINLIKERAADLMTPYITERSAAWRRGSYLSSRHGTEKSTAATRRRSVSNERNTCRQKEPH